MAATALLALLSIALHNAGAVTIAINNSCPFPVWPGWISGEGGELPQLGAQLESMQSMQLDVPRGWGGRFWGRTGCLFDTATGRGTCQTGDCGNSLACGAAGGIPPVTLTEFKLNGYDARDFYDVSLVDGYNLPVRVTPSDARCPAVGCHSDVNANCPRELQVAIHGRVVGCKSACEAFQTDAFCCRGAHSQSQSCSPTQYSRIFKQHCPQAYSYAYDDLSSTFTCASGAGYAIEFCPGGAGAQQQRRRPPRRHGLEDIVLNAAGHGGHGRVVNSSRDGARYHRRQGHHHHQR
ncbi:hypothetical protein SELMODRAFT_402999 [Selaginella moellendorffii]|uniref:Thaumatin-like protein n=1 Tax=Selaginella moellendorffii TaxID=88036 RepID=D8QNQ8_SELML|nr:pathogenesis-related protein 5 [Selaginella moellendorffii]EFJ38798.1 hypothetical protein SELMODRAFT_402999 [Selaginella moellendorffii]|eukprot:XP_002961259.1 pathogenesis-related protein 5 [Selaginella moellendorffii]